MAPGIATRSQKLSKLSTSSTFLKRDKVILNKNSPRNSPNCSLIEIKHVEKATDDATETNINILGDLRNKLATTQFSLKELEEKYNTSQAELDKLKQLNDLYRAQIDEHKATIELLATKISSKTVTNAETQTDTLDEIQTVKNTAIKYFPTENLIKDVQTQDKFSENTHKLSTKQRENQSRKIVTKPKVMMLADSHGRSCATILKENLKEFSVEVVFKPNAKLEQITEDISALTTNFAKQDYVIILGGTNDESHVKNIINVYIKLIKKLYHTNVIICGIPYRYDYLHRLNTKYFDVNNALYNLSLQNRHTIYFDINKFANKNSYTRQGLHLNLASKIIMCREMSYYINRHVRYRLNQSHMPSNANNSNLTQIKISDEINCNTFLA